MGIIGVSLGLMIGRSILTVAYPKMIGQFLKINLSTQIKASIRPALVTITLFLAATGIESRLPTQSWHSIEGWVFFFLSAGLTACLVLVISFISGLSSEQQKTILNRVQSAIVTSTK